MPPLHHSLREKAEAADFISLLNVYFNTDLQTDMKTTASYVQLTKICLLYQGSPHPGDADQYRSMAG